MSCPIADRRTPRSSFPCQQHNARANFANVHATFDALRDHLTENLRYFVSFRMIWAIPVLQD